MKANAIYTFSINEQMCKIQCIENLNGIQYRVPKDAIFDGESKGTYQDIEPYRDNHILNFESYDGTYHFIYTIFYPNFLNAEEVQKLRNMVEFFDSMNNPEFKLQEHVVFPELATYH